MSINGIRSSKRLSYDFPWLSAMLLEQQCRSEYEPKATESELYMWRMTGSKQTSGVSGKIVAISRDLRRGCLPTLTETGFPRRYFERD